MQDVDHHAADVQHLVLRQGMRPRTFVIVAADRRHWRNPAQCLQYRVAHDIARMDNDVAAGEKLDSFRPQQAVCIRDEPYAHRISRLETTLRLRKFLHPSNHNYHRDRMAGDKIPLKQPTRSRERNVRANPASTHTDARRRDVTFTFCTSRYADLHDGRLRDDGPV